ncbi:hypothetical protein N7492_006715 [Penicillium capsulatum]|uniref:Fungal pheromone mating factor STE2 GPCR-domain-containing protein n=1 Tax=Penicillium capsulatum TaxID=69766 RepID=A0A9W9I0R7_9EURO|nr:hypothetical protein N7492_006715 [Penicillium capsulatum]KAJ6116550.1 hypothetical protein N7512_006275 [Penicillium capsulatum]
MDSFNPYLQNVTFRRPEGELIQVPMDELDMFLQYNVRICINYASQLGASIVLFLILLLLTRKEKRGSLLFVLNSLALLFNIGRLLCQVIHFTTGFEEVYAYFAFDYSAVPASAYAISILSVTLETLVVICTMVSLVMQVNAVCKTLRRRYRRPMLVLSVLMALTPIAFRMAWMVENDIYIMKAESMEDVLWLESDTNIIITTSICFFCAVFVTKLGYAIRQRRRLGVHDFGPMQVIFVCGCQTLTIPAILSILQYCIRVPELHSSVITLVAISLPLSSIWAGITLGSRRAHPDPDRCRNFWQVLAFNSDGSTLPSTKQSSTELMAPGVAQMLCYSNRTSNKSDYDSESPLGISVERGLSVNSVHRLDV